MFWAAGARPVHLYIVVGPAAQPSRALTREAQEHPGKTILRGENAGSPAPRKDNRPETDAKGSPEHSTTSVLPGSLECMSRMGEGCKRERGAQELERPLSSVLRVGRAAS